MSTGTEVQGAGAGSAGSGVSGRRDVGAGWQAVRTEREGRSAA